MFVFDLIDVRIIVILIGLRYKFDFMIFVYTQLALLSSNIFNSQDEEIQFNLKFNLVYQNCFLWFIWLLVIIPQKFINFLIWLLYLPWWCYINCSQDNFLLILFDLCQYHIDSNARMINISLFKRYNLIQDQINIFVLF